MNQKKKLFDNSIYRLVIRNIEGYGTLPADQRGIKRVPGRVPELDNLKQRILQRLIRKQSKRKAKLVNWSIAWQTHIASGLPHLDILLVYERNFQAVYTTFDYLIKDLKIQQRYTDDQISHGHVWVTPYSSKKLNKAILQYGQKEDPQPLSNITIETKDDLTRLNKLKHDPYRYLELQMLKDPLHFNLQQYCRKHDLNQYLSTWSSLKTRLKDSQLAAANLKLKSKSGFKYIDRALIQSVFSPQQLLTYDSWSGYQTIVDHLNQIPLYGCNRPFKMKNLFVVSPPNKGKTTLALQIRKSTSTYCMDVSNWFPAYRSGVYKFILWDQFKLKGGMCFTDVLKFLQGLQMDLQHKGGTTLRSDNQFIYMTSNMSLSQHIALKFKDPEHRQLAQQNLRARIQQIVISKGYDLFLLLKLFN